MNEREIYQRGLQKYGASPMALHWVDYRSMAIRHKNLVRDLEFEKRSILDAGCGMGDILPYIYAKADHFEYLGVDINSGFIDIARQRYAGQMFEVGNPFNGKFKGRYDIVLSSGVMNINVRDWQKNRRIMIKNLFELTDYALAFNMAGGLKPAPTDPLIAYADAEEIAEYCRTLASKVILSADYLPQDFTITMFK